MTRVLKLISVVLLCALAAPFASAGEASPASRLERGVFYYHYLNNDFQLALNSLSRLKALGGGSDTESRLMQAAVFLALGLNDDAQQLLQTATVSDATADAWFYLARAQAKNNQWDACEQSARNALSNTHATPLNPAYQDEAYYWLVSAMARQDRINEAKDQLAYISENSVWAGYARYNLILARMRLYSPGRDIEKLVEEAIYYLPPTLEGTALKDRILLVTGIQALNNGKPEEAEIYLRQMTLDGPFTAPGLLQYGWAMMEQLRYDDALQPWRILQQKFQAFHPAVLESVLGVPHALELMNATTQSLKTYELVEKKLVAMRQRLDAVDDAATGEWLQQWLAGQDSQWGWARTSTGDMPDSEISQTLQSLLDDPEFTSSTFRLHEINAMLNQTEQQLADLALWDDTLHRRQQTLSSLDGQKRLASLEQQQQALSLQVSDLEQRLAAEDTKVFAWASPADEANTRRLAQVVPNVTRLQQVGTPTRDLSEYKERWRRTRGLLLWSVYEYTPERRWQARDAFWKLQADISSLYEQLNNTRSALSWANSSWQGFPQQVAVMRQRLLVQQQQLTAMKATETQVVHEQVRNHVATLKLRITDYLAQARLAIARLYDDALQQNIAEQEEGAENAITTPQPAQGEVAGE